MILGKWLIIKLANARSKSTLGLASYFTNGKDQYFSARQGRGPLEYDFKITDILINFLKKSIDFSNLNNLSIFPAGRHVRRLVARCVELCIYILKHESHTYHYIHKYHHLNLTLLTFMLTAQYTYIMLFSRFKPCKAPQ